MNPVICLGHIEVKSPIQRRGAFGEFVEHLLREEGVVVEEPSLNKPTLVRRDDFGQEGSESRH